MKIVVVVGLWSRTNKYSDQISSINAKFAHDFFVHEILYEQIDKIDSAIGRINRNQQINCIAINVIRFCCLY